MTKLTLAMALTVMATVGAFAQAGGDKMSHDKMADDKMAKPMTGKAMTHTGCVMAGSQAGSYMLNMSADAGMKTDATMKGDAAMHKDTMAKDAAMPTSVMLMGTTVDLSKHVGHKVAVTGMMGKMDPMPKAGTMPMSTMTVSSLKMIGTSCGM